jgi:hypothetical protein
MSKMCLHDSFGHLKRKLWPKEKLGVKLAVWLPTAKSQELIRFPCVQVACDIPLEISQWGLQLLFKIYLNRRSRHKVMGPQSRENPNFRNFRTPIWESWDKMSFQCGLLKKHKVYYKGEGGGFPQVWAMVSLVSLSLLVNPANTKSVQIMH